MGWSGFDGQKYHMRQKPRKAFKNVKHYQDISTNKEAKLVVRENMHNSFWNLLKHAITVKNTI